MVLLGSGNGLTHRAASTRARKLLVPKGTLRSCPQFLAGPGGPSGRLSTLSCSGRPGPPHRGTLWSEGVNEGMRQGVKE